MPWILGGDFYTVLDSSERKGGGGNVTSMRNFGSFISKMKVINIPLRGISFTWTNHRERASWAKLDRFLISPLLISWMPNIVQVGLSGTISDHNVVMIGEKK
ncbi:hypothetical protein Dsin_029259 [Dipteronia sinensis]|uniref:Endonuclease/exonuclease/phosphatase domain-containing protein n=1 Tax=Dipteronia sinensis TaxID=43782 RepID=A0AAE0DV03_9ROSI|nr:hypothetical protein Dsin_029259 [Dipteronia sinensis]